MINIKELSDLQKFKLEQVEKEYLNNYENYHLIKYKEIAKLLLLPDNYFKTVVETLFNTKIEDSLLHLYKDYLVEFGHLPTDKKLNSYFGKRMKQGDLLLNVNYFYFLQKPEYFATIEFENLESCNETCIETALKHHFNGKYPYTKEVCAISNDSSIPYNLRKDNKLWDKLYQLIKDTTAKINDMFYYTGTDSIYFSLWCARYLEVYKKLPPFDYNANKERLIRMSPYNLEDLDNELLKDIERLNLLNSELNKNND